MQQKSYTQKEDHLAELLELIVRFANFEGGLEGSDGSCSFRGFHQPG